MRTSAVVLSFAVLLGVAGPAAAQPESLATLYELGGAVADTNGDGVADRLRARVVLGDSPSAAEVAAAADIAARLGFETMALNLPLPAASEVAIAVGDEALVRIGNLRPLRSGRRPGRRRTPHRRGIGDRRGPRR